MRHYLSASVISILLVCTATGPAGAQYIANPANVPSDIKAIMDKPAYKNSIWGLRVVDLETGQPLIDLEPGHQFFIGSVRKVFTIGELLNQIGPKHTFDTPIYRRGPISDRGTLRGDLILVASGDLTMGGRTNPDGSIAVTNFDHNEANSLGNAQLTKPDPLAGYAALARQIAASGIKEVAGDVVIDDRLFKPYLFRDEFEFRPIFVNDDVVDLIINPREVGDRASVKHRPHSAALAVDNDVVMRPAGSDINIAPGQPACIGKPDCTATLSGDLPVGFVPPLTNHFPLIRVFRIADPSSYARTVLIEKLRAAGVKVDAPTVEPNPIHLLPAKSCYELDMRVAELHGLSYAEDAKLIAKVSYNIGADTSLLLYGVTQGANDMPSALAAEKKNLQTNYGISPSEYFFVDGSGGGPTTAINRAVTHMLAEMHGRPTFPQYFASFPIMGVDGSLAFVTDFESDSTLAPAKGHVHTKPGSLVADVPQGSFIRGQAFGGYIKTKSGRELVYQLVVNNVPYRQLSDLLQIFQDQGTISAILWRDN
jgi:D-alanyl-D-alanine carboxypeptidase/D-alanyl-D-alanine-endopeptidase (penicillin-binding protein 4)